MPTRCEVACELGEVAQSFGGGRDTSLLQLLLDLFIRHGLNDDVPAARLVVLLRMINHLAGEHGEVVGVEARLLVALGETLEGAEDEAVVGLDVWEVLCELGEDFFGLEAGWVAAAEDDLDCCCWRGDMCVAHENIIARVEGASTVRCASASRGIRLR